MDYLRTAANQWAERKTINQQQAELDSLQQLKAVVEKLKVLLRGR